MTTRGRGILCRSAASPTTRSARAVIVLSGLLRRRNRAVLTPCYETLVCARIQNCSSSFGPAIRWNRLDGLGGGGFGGRGEGGRSRDWHTAEVRGELHEAMMVRMLRKTRAVVQAEDREIAQNVSRGTSTWRILERTVSHKEEPTHNDMPREWDSEQAIEYRWTIDSPKPSQFPSSRSQAQHLKTSYRAQTSRAARPAVSSAHFWSLPRGNPSLRPRRHQGFPARVDQGRRQSLSDACMHKCTMQKRIHAHARNWSNRVGSLLHDAIKVLTLHRLSACMSMRACVHAKRLCG